MGHSKSETIAAIKVGDIIRIRTAGGPDKPTRYHVRKIRGNKARELDVSGLRGAARTIVDAGDAIWLREHVSGQRRARADARVRRVISIEIVGAPEQWRLENARPRAQAPERPGISIDTAAARARLPMGYDVGITNGGFVALHCEMNGEMAEVNVERVSAWEAVVDAWEDAEKRALKALTIESLLARSEKAMSKQWEESAIELEADLVEAKQARDGALVALGQLANITRGEHPGNEPLADVQPSAVVIEVAAALLRSRDRESALRDRPWHVGVDWALPVRMQGGGG